MGIILYHVSGGLANPAVTNGFNLENATWNINYIFVQLTSFLGPIGNNIFWICSCWFFIGDNRMSKHKLFGLVVDVWLISVLILCFVLYDFGNVLAKEHIRQSLLPTFYENNWYVTCYILMYAVHPLINMAIERLSQRGLFRTVLSFTILYIIISALRSHFFFSMTILWTTVYFIVAYIKLYLDEPSKNIRFNLACIFICILALTGFNFTVNYLDTHKGIHLTNLLAWSTNQNPFVILLALSMFNIVRNYRFENKAINYLSGLTLFIYVIHENLLLRTYYRPSIWNWIYEIDNYNFLILDCIIFSFVLFIGSILASSIYVRIIKKPLTGIINRLYRSLQSQYLKFESYLIDGDISNDKVSTLEQSNESE